MVGKGWENEGVWREGEKTVDFVELTKTPSSSFQELDLTLNLFSLFLLSLNTAPLSSLNVPKPESSEHPRGGSGTQVSRVESCAPSFPSPPSLARSCSRLPLVRFDFLS